MCDAISIRQMTAASSFLSVSIFFARVEFVQWFDYLRASLVAATIYDCLASIPEVGGNGE